MKAGDGRVSLFLLNLSPKPKSRRTHVNDLQALGRGDSCSPYVSEISRDLLRARTLGAADRRARVRSRPSVLI